MKTLFSLLLVLCCTTLMIAQEAATESAASLYNAALTEMKAKNYEAALEGMLKAIESVDPDSESDAKVLRLAKGNGAIAAYYSGNTFLKEKNYDEAMARFEKGTELNPKSYTCLYGQARVLDGKDMMPEAIAAYFVAAEAATAAGKADRGEKYVARAENMVGSTYSKKKYDDAIAAGEAFLASKESKSVSYYMAKSLLAKGKASDALAHAEKAKELGGDEDEGKYIMVLAETLEAMGNKSGAVAAYKQIPAGKYKEMADYKAKSL